MEPDTHPARARSDQATQTPPDPSSPAHLTVGAAAGPRRPRHRLATALGVAAVALLLAACGSSSKTATSNSPGTTAANTATTAAPATTGSTTLAQALAAVGAAKATGKTLSLAKDAHGIFLIGPDGHTLYVFAKDQGTTTACTGACATAWPPLMTTGTPTTGPGVDATKITVVAGQVAYGGHLLYGFANDSAPGQTNGVGIPNWNLLGPVGNVMGTA